ncbi:hypothetical protein [Hymenobacter negativus]|uniref:Uncharacterized protein n=1 Tax=Hymenobacter negativus TaxID=2795026 RepID=A0ABS3QJI8_9BACT|nr:hypothetical protein [Hymenobacter negativus]MBO2010929.1 hypothetical protein [Hymenobacter negativus]
MAALSTAPQLHPNETTEHTYFLMEFLLHGLAEHSLISRNRLTAGAQFQEPAFLDVHHAQLRRGRKGEATPPVRVSSAGF